MAGTTTMTTECQFRCRKSLGVFILLMCCTSHYAEARLASQFETRAEAADENFRGDLEASNHDDETIPQKSPEAPSRSFESFLNLPGSRKLSFLVPASASIMPYHNGIILSGGPEIAVYVIWYGTFSAAEKAPIVDFFSSFSSGSTVTPSVASWWKITSGYKDSAGLSVSNTVKLAGQQELPDYSLGKNLKNSDIESLVLNSLSTLIFPVNYNALYLVLTAEDVSVGDFCNNECGSHFSTGPSPATKGQQLPFAYVGNSASRCPGLCAWPYAKAAYGPQVEPLLPPNGNVGVDGMIITIGQILAGVATNPFNNGFYQGDAAYPLEAATACAGIYGAGAFPGYPGQLLVQPITGASYNVNGASGRQFLLPALLDPVRLECVSP